MAELKYGGSDVKIMYGSQEIGGAAKLEPGTILYMSRTAEGNFKGEVNFESVHLLSTTKNWSNIDGIHLQAYTSNNIRNRLFDEHISSDDFKSLDKGKQYSVAGTDSMTVSRSIIDGEYRLNASTSHSFFILVVSAI